MNKTSILCDRLNLFDTLCIWFFISSIILLFIIVGYMAGSANMKSKMKDEAVKHNVAEFKVDKKSGKTIFIWRKKCLK